MKKKAKPKPVNPEEAKARFFKLNRQRSRVVYQRQIAECEGNMEAYNELDKSLADLNEEIAELEAGART